MGERADAIRPDRTGAGVGGGGFPEWRWPPGRRRPVARALEPGAARTIDDLGPATHERRFELADHVKVVGASLVNGLLTIDLKREIPEEMKPRRIEIGSTTATPKVAQRKIEAEKQAA